MEDDEYAEALEKRLTTEKIQNLQKGTIIDWALESHIIAQKYAYNIPRNRRLEQEYLDSNYEVVNDQLLRGGLRLAKILNDTLP